MKKLDIVGGEAKAYFGMVAGAALFVAHFAESRFDENAVKLGSEMYQIRSDVYREVDKCFDSPDTKCSGVGEVPDFSRKIDNVHPRVLAFYNSTTTSSSHDPYFALRANPPVFKLLQSQEVAQFTAQLSGGFSDQDKWKQFFKAHQFYTIVDQAGNVKDYAFDSVARPAPEKNQFWKPYVIRDFDHSDERIFYVNLFKDHPRIYDTFYTHQINVKQNRRKNDPFAALREDPSFKAGSLDGGETVKRIENFFDQFEIYNKQYEELCVLLFEKYIPFMLGGLIVLLKGLIQMSLKKKHKEVLHQVTRRKNKNGENQGLSIEHFFVWDDLVLMAVHDAIQKIGGFFLKAKTQKLPQNLVEDVSNNLRDFVSSMKTFQPGENLAEKLNAILQKFDLITSGKQAHPVRAYRETNFDYDEALIERVRLDVQRCLDIQNDGQNPSLEITTKNLEDIEALVAMFEGQDQVHLIQDTTEALPK